MWVPNIYSLTETYLDILLDHAAVQDNEQVDVLVSNVAVAGILMGDKCDILKTKGE